jgi:hypothetical protein
VVRATDLRPMREPPVGQESNTTTMRALGVCRDLTPRDRVGGPERGGRAAPEFLHLSTVEVR